MAIMTIAIGTATDTSIESTLMANANKPYINVRMTAHSPSISVRVNGIASNIPKTMTRTNNVIR